VPRPGKQIPTYQLHPHSGQAKVRIAGKDHAIPDECADSGIVRNQINHRVNRIKKLFKWGVSRELIPLEALQRLKTVEGLVFGQTNAPEG